MKHTGILLTNTGTPDDPSQQAVRRYLREFLSDRRIVQLPRLLWLPILYGIILPFRTKKSAKLYQSIWTNHGSPLRSNMQAIKKQLQETLNQTTDQQYTVEIGMNYGNPSIQSAVTILEKARIDELITLPLFPQYSNTSTASSHDRLNEALKTYAHIPNHYFINDYAEHPAYISSLCDSLLNFWRTHEKSQHLLMSFHGIPQRFIEKGDPYQMRCEQTANALAAALNLADGTWTLSYQSQFGYDNWLQPSTQALFQSLPKAGIKSIDIICPGFSVDCLETLEEIAINGKEIFLQAGGHQFQYCKTLNADYPYISDILKKM